MKENNATQISIESLVAAMRNHKKLFLYSLPIAFGIACIIALSRPRYYTCDVALAPESDNSMNSGALSSLASSFLGGNMNLSNDAIQPTLYPDLMESKEFQVRLFDVHVKSLDGEIDTNYYNYLLYHQKFPWWDYPRIWISQLIKSDDNEDNGVSTGDNKGPDPFHLTKQQDKIADAVKANIKCMVDKKTDVITISVKAQDKLICATMADSVRILLQKSITEYRTNKARIDMEYYQKLKEEAKDDYEQARRRYASYADANMNSLLQSVNSNIDDLENDMQLKYNTYTAISTQYQMAKAKVQERTPAFTILQGASVPVLPTGPKRTIFVLGVLFMTFTVELLYAFRKDIKKQL